MLRSFNQAYLGVVTPLYLLSRGASAAEVGVLVTVWASGSALLGLGAGFVSDRFGRKLVLAIFSALSAVAALAFYFDMPFWMLALAGALGTIGRGGGPASGGAFGPFYSAEQALVAEHVPPQTRTRAFAAFSMIGAIGGAFGFLLTYVHEYRLVFPIASGISVLLLISIAPIRESSRQERGAHRERETRRPPQALSARTRAIVLRFMVTNATNGLAVGFLGPMLVLWFHLRYHAPADQIGTIYMVIGFCTIASYSVVGRAVAFIGGAVRTVVSLRVVSCALLAVLPLMPTVWFAGAVFLVRVLVNSMTLPVRQSYVMGIVSPHERSRVASVSNVPSQFASMAGPSLAGVMLHSVWIGAMLEAAALLQLPQRRAVLGVLSQDPAARGTMKAGYAVDTMRNTYALLAAAAFLGSTAAAGAQTSTPRVIAGTITAVSGSMVTIQRSSGSIVVNDQPALNSQTTGNVAVGRQVVARGYWQDGTFYATSFADANVYGYADGFGTQEGLTGAPVPGRLRGLVRGTISAVSGHLVTIQGNGNSIVINDQPALDRKLTGSVNVGRDVVAVGYWRGGTFYATTISDASSTNVPEDAPNFGAFAHIPDSLSGTITGVSGNQVTLQQSNGTIVLNDQPALNAHASGNVAVGRQVVADGYWLHGIFYATSFADALP